MSYRHNVVNFSLLGILFSAPRTHKCCSKVGFHTEMALVNYLGEIRESKTKHLYIKAEGSCSMFMWEISFYYSIYLEAIKITYIVFNFLI